MDTISSLIGPLRLGLQVTLRITLGAALLAIPLAVLAGLARLLWLRMIATVYVEIFRGTSALVQRFWFYFVLPMFGLRLPAILVGIVVPALGNYLVAMFKDTPPLSAITVVELLQQSRSSAPAPSATPNP